MLDSLNSLLHVHTICNATSKYNVWKYGIYSEKELLSEVLYNYKTIVFIYNYSVAEKEL